MTMDPKGDRLRKIQSGLLKLPDSVLKNNNIVLSTEKPARGGGGCLEGGPRPRSTKVEEGISSGQNSSPMILATGNNIMTLSAAEIPLPSPSADKSLPSHVDIPLPEDAGDIPLPVSDMGNIPLPSEPRMITTKHEDIPLPSNDTIPLPAEKPPSQRRIKVQLEPRGDELLCRSCVMTFSKQIEYDIHLQSEAHQQAIKSDLPDGVLSATSLLNKRPEKSPCHDGNKSGHVSFSFKKNLGPKITNTQPFVVRREDKRASPIEVKLLKPENGKEKNATADDVVEETKEATDGGNKIEGENGSENVQIKTDKLVIPESRLLMSDFVKVQSKDDSGRVLDWPKEMIQYTESEPKLMFSCNPLSFDFSQLFSAKKQTKTENHDDSTVKESVIGDLEQEIADNKTEEGQKEDTDEKKKSRKKKKKKKHKKHKANKEVKEGEETEAAKAEEDGTSKKKKKKHKRKHDDKDVDTTKESLESSVDNIEEKDKDKKSKKKKKKSKQSEGEGDKNDDDEKKHKKRKKKKSKKRKKKHHAESDKEEKTDGEKEKIESGDSAKESDPEKKDKEGKKKRKKRKKHKKKDGEGNETSESETEKVDPVQPEIIENAAIAPSGITVKKRKFPEGDSDGESEKIVAKLQALSRTKIVPKQAPVNNPVLQKKIKKEPVDTVEKKTPSERKRVTSESSVNESTPIKKIKVTPKASGVKDNIAVNLMQLANATVKVEKEESWSKIETQTNDNVKSKWDTSDSDVDNAPDDTIKKEKVLRKHNSVKNVLAGNKANILKDLKSPKGRNIKIENEQKKPVSSSQRSNKSNVSAGSAKLLNAVGEKNSRKSRKASASPSSSHSRSRSRSRGRHRSYSASESSRSRSRSYSSSSAYSDDSRHSRYRRSRHSSSASYYHSSSRSRSRSYHRHRGRSSSYSDYSRSRSYSSSRSRSRSHRRGKRSYSRSRSRSYSSSSSSSRSRSRNRSYRKPRRKHRRRHKRVSRGRSRSKTPVVNSVSKKKEEKEEKEKVKEDKNKVDPSDIPLPDLSGKKDDERSEEKLKKLKEKTRRGDVGEKVAKLVESLPADIPLPFSEGVTKTVSSDSLPSGPPGEALKENDSGFIGPKMPAPPPPPPMGRGFPPNHGPPGPPRPGWGGQGWDHWDAPGPWDSMGPWDGPGPRPHYRGMRPPFDHRMYGPYDPRRRGPPPFMNRPRGPHPYMGPRYPGPGGPHGPHPDYTDYGYDYNAEYEHPNPNTEEEPTQNTSSTPPPLPKEPPKESSPKPPLPKKKVKEQEPEQNPDIVIPPEQAEQYIHLQKQARKHARRQQRRQAKKDLGEPDEDSTSSESEVEEPPAQEVAEEVAVVEEAQTPQLVVPQQVVLQPQPTGSPSGAYIIVSGGQQFLVQKPQIVQAATHLQAGQPVVVSQSAILATAHAAASGAQPAHIVQQVPAALSGHPMIAAAPTHITASGVPVAMASAASIQHLQQVQQLQQMQQIQQIQQIQQAQAIQAHNIQAHNQAVAAAAAAQHGSIVLGGRILVPTIGVRPAI
ncbi:hypothetical protein ACF0H5_011873 [Mactra antiquata]